MEILRFSDIPYNNQDLEILNMLYKYATNIQGKILCLDLETTSPKPAKNEILQCSMIDGFGQIISNGYFRPIDVDEWPQAEEVNHISPEKVSHCTSFLPYVKKAQKIIDNYDIIVTYNGIHFDIPILEKYGISFDGKKHYDVAEHFAKYHGEIFDGNEEHIKFRLKKLEFCAERLEFPKEQSVSLHDALGDTEVTLFCFYKLLSIQLEDAEKQKRFFEKGVR